MSDIYLSLTETPSVVTLSQPVVSGVLSSTVTVANTVTVALDANSLAALESVTVTVGNVTIGSSVSISNFPATQVVSISNLPASQVVTISNLPATQTVAGTVTANVLGWDGSNNEPYRIGGYSIGVGDSTRLALEVVGIDGSPVAISGAVTANGGNSLGDVFSGGFLAMGLDDLSSCQALNLDGDGNLRTRIDACVTHGVNVANSITIGSLPAISGTVTANAVGYDYANQVEVRIPVSDSSGSVLASIVDFNGSVIVPISGTVTVSSLPASTVTVSNFPATQSVQGTVTANINGTVPVSGNFWQATQPVSLASLPASTVTVSSLPASTVTVSALPSGALTTRFGSVTTANTAQLTSAVTNTSRKYLLLQNIATSTVTIGIGFTPTTTQGIQLTAGAGLTFDAFCPTGGVWWLSSTTGSNFSILEG